MSIPTLSAHGATMPVIGLGTSGMGDVRAETIATALKLGYRHIDTAWKYGTEREVGEGMRAAGVPRADIFLCTKVSHEYLQADDFARSVDESLKTLGVDYVDLLLVHWPNLEIPLGETMTALAKAKRQGLARHLGVANFNIALLDQAIALCPEPLVTLQAEYHPYLDQTTLLDACRARGLIYTAYCPLGRGRLLKEPVLAEIARHEGQDDRASGAALARPERDRRADSALVEPGSPGREHGGVRFLAERRGDEAHRRAQAAGRPHRQSGRPRAALGCVGFARPRSPHGEEHAIAGAASHAGLARVRLEPWAARSVAAPILRDARARNLCRLA